jgi:hypothetical protein
VLELRLSPLTLWPLVLCVPLVVCEDGGGGGGILAPDEVRPAPPPDSAAREGSDALGFREDVTWSQRDDVEAAPRRASDDNVNISRQRAA